MKVTTIPLLLMLFVFTGCGDETSEPFVPDDMVGTWETKAAKYRGCVLQMWRTQVSFENKAEAHRVRYSVKGVKTVSEKGETVVVIDYRDEHNEKGSLSLIRDGESLRFQYNRDVVWTRKK